MHGPQGRVKQEIGNDFKKVVTTGMRNQSIMFLFFLSFCCKGGGGWRRDPSKVLLDLFHFERVSPS